MSQERFNYSMPVMEVLAAQPVNELCTSATIKVCWVSDEPNPNNTVINKEVGKEIAATLPGAPVAGLFNKETGDFEEHSRRIHFKDGEFEIEDLTRPYGFVCPVTAPWYQEFVEDGITRTYLCCTAYLWTKQYEEANKALGKGQSMELYEPDMVGYYEGTGSKAFIFTSATLDKLCILGDAFAPCFSGANIMANYAKQYNTFAQQLEQTIGRRYYVMGDQLVQKPEGPITLNYALELGWPLTDAIYNQLSAKKMGDTYWVKGVYSEGGEIFCILEDHKNGGYAKCSLTITDSDTVDLQTDSMTSVKMTWSALPAPATGTNYQKEGEPAMTAPQVTDPNPALHAAQPPAAAAPPAGAFADKDDEKCPECGNDPCTCDDDDKADNSKHSAKPAAAPAPAAPDYQTMYNVAVAKNLEYEAKIADFTAQVATDAATITSLNSAIAGYRAQIEAASTTSKEGILAEYAAILTQEEMTAVKEFAAKPEATPESVEAKCAVLFSKRAKATPPSQFQLNVAALPASGPSMLPDYMKQAMEYDLEDPLALKGATVVSKR